MVYAAASLTDSLTELGAPYEKAHGYAVHFNFGASSLLARQIQEGGPADLFFAADEATMDALQRNDLLIPDTRRDLLANSLVFIVPKEGGRDLKTVKDLAGAEWKRIALAQPDSVPAGVYARQYLTSMHLWDAIKDRVVPTENVRAALAAIESGDADVGVVYKTDALISKKVRVVLEVPAVEGPKISYPIAILKSSKNTGEARKFEEYLGTPGGRAVFEKLGFVVPVSL
jgi:molybdate transport system substrate-binding protein